MSSFNGTAQYYDLYRPNVPVELVEKIVAVLPPNALPHLLDLGSGTGKVLERFLPHFTDVFAVESSEEMMALAKCRLVPRIAADTSIHFVTGQAEDLELPEEWRAGLVTICRSFHWMDRPLVLQKLETMVAPDGVVAVFADKSIWNLEEPWCVVLKGIVQEILGQERRGEDEFFKPDEPFKDAFAVSAFTKIDEFSLPITRTWTVEQLIGLLYSYSFAAKPLFGDFVEQFETAVKQRLLPLGAPDGTFTEPNAFSVLLARRP